MKLIKPTEISGRILSLLDESEEMVILVSPYVKISKWYKMVNKLERLKPRQIITEIYVRDDPENEASYRDLDQLKLSYKKIPHLHSKLYLNERYGIVTSMNLLLSSEINSLEIAYETETWEEYNDLLGYYYKYIYNGEPVRQDEPVVVAAVALKEIRHSIGEALRNTGKNAWLWLANNSLHICTGRNSYIISINDGYLSIMASLGEFKKAKMKDSKHGLAIKKILRDLTAMNITVYPDFKSDILKLRGEAHNRLKSTCITGILNSDKANVIESVIQFIDVADNLIDNRIHPN